LCIESVLLFVAIGMTQAPGLPTNVSLRRVTSSQIQQVTMSHLFGALIGAFLRLPVVSRV
jgi:hypothetical protein